MKSAEIPMHRPDGTTVQLVELLNAIPANNWFWSILEFNGVGEMPNNMSVAEFEAWVQILPQGNIVSWAEINCFARSIEYTIDCLIVARKEKNGFDAKKLFLDDFQGCEVGLRAIDSGIWLLAATDNEIFDSIMKQK